MTGKANPQLLYTLLLRLTPRFPPPRAPQHWSPMSPQTPSPLPPGGLLFGSLRSAAARRKPSLLGPSRSCSAPLAGLNSSSAPAQGLSGNSLGLAEGLALDTGLSPGALASPASSASLASEPAAGDGSPQSKRVVSGSSTGTAVSTASASGRVKELRAEHLDDLPSGLPTERRVKETQDETDARNERDERADLLAPLRLSPADDLPPHTLVDLEGGYDYNDDGYESSNSESSIIDMPRRRVSRLDAESITEVAEQAGASVISVVAGIGGMVRRSASRGLLGSSPGYGTFD